MRWPSDNAHCVLMLCYFLEAADSFCTRRPNHRVSRSKRSSPYIVANANAGAHANFRVFTASWRGYVLIC